MNQEPKSIQINGKILFRTLKHYLKNIDIYINLEDITYQDTSSNIIKTMKLSNVTLEPGDERFLDFNLNENIEDDKKMFIISVHVDMNRNGVIDSGDYITTKYYTIQPNINPNYIVVEVTRID
jgi:Trm5-related predicted tRNA methylase